MCAPILVVDMSSTLKRRANATKASDPRVGPSSPNPTPFSSDAFKKNAAKAYAAKKRAMERIQPAGKSPQQRKLDAQKGFARRQSLKQARKAAAAASAANKSGKTVTLEENPSTECESLQVAPLQRSATFSSPPASNTPVAPSTPTKTRKPASTLGIGYVHHNAPDDGNWKVGNGSEMSYCFDKCTSSAIEISPTKGAISPPVSFRSSDFALDAPPKQPLSIQSLQPVAIRAATREVTPLASCSVDIALARAMSSCTSAGSSTDSARTPAAPARAAPSSGKWCPECAGVGLHVAALLTELAQWRTDDERRGSHSSNSGSSRSGWKRMMSQTLIGESRSSRSAQDRARLQQQVDVLTTTVQFLHQKLANADEVGDDVRAAVERCAIRTAR